MGKNIFIRLDNSVIIFVFIKTNKKCVNNAHFSVILLNNFQGPTIRLWYVSLERMIPVSAALRPLRMMQDTF